MKIRHYLTIFLAVLGIILLLALAAFVTVYIGSETDPIRQKIMQVLHLDQPETDDDSAAATEALPPQTETASVKEHSLVFVGDSRTIGMRDAVNDNCTYIGAEGEGYYWLASDGQAALNEQLNGKPGQNVVINLGVNDPENVNLYVDFYSSLIKDHPDTSFYFLSVNPLIESENLNTTNEMISLFNATVQSYFPDQYLDSNSYLTRTGFQTIDGLHYTDDTYNKIHNFVVEQIG